MFSSLIGSPSISGDLPYRVTFPDPNTWVLAYAELEATQRACTGRRCDGLERFVSILRSVLVFDRGSGGAVLRDGGCSNRARGVGPRNDMTSGSFWERKIDR